MDKIQGVVCPMITPLDKNRCIDERAARILAARLVNKKAKGFFLFGTMGEGPMLPIQEKKRLVDIVTEIVDSTVTVMVNTTGMGPGETEYNMSVLEKTKADVFVLTPPMFYNVRQEDELIHYYEYFSGITKKPLFIYDVKYTNNYIPDYIIEKLSLIKNIIGFKGCLFQHQNVFRNCMGREDFALLHGNEKTIDLALTLGADGCIPGISSLAMDICIELYNKAKDKDFRGASQLQKKLHDVQDVVYGKGGIHWANGHKYALSVLGICEDNIATTLLPLTEKDKKDIREIITKYHIT